MSSKGGGQKGRLRGRTGGGVGKLTGVIVQGAGKAVVDKATYSQ